MKIWLIQSVLSPYRIPLFKLLAETPEVDFKLVLSSKDFKTRPQWKRDLTTLPFAVDIPFGISIQTGREKQYCLNPFLIFKLLREQPDIVICGGFSPATVMVLFASLVSRIRYVIWTEGTMATDGHIGGIRLKIRRLLARRAGAMVEAGSQARKYLEYLLPGLHPSSLFRSYNCVDNRYFMAVGREGGDRQLRREMPPRNIVFVGKLNERKGVPQLMKVYQRLQRKTRVGLILIGEGELRPQLEAIKTRESLHDLHLLGWLKNEETAHYYSAADLFILLSLQDQNPLVLFEALAVGVPIICSKHAGNAVDFIQDGLNGYIVDPLDIEAVGQRVEEVLTWDEERRRACARFSRELVQKANYNDAAKAFVSACRYALGLPKGEFNRTPEVAQ